MPVISNRLPWDRYMASRSKEKNREKTDKKLIGKVSFSKRYNNLSKESRNSNHFVTDNDKGKKLINAIG